MDCLTCFHHDGGFQCVGRGAPATDASVNPGVDGGVAVYTSDTTITSEDSFRWNITTDVLTIKHSFSDTAGDTAFQIFDSASSNAGFFSFEEGTQEVGGFLPQIRGRSEDRNGFGIVIMGEIPVARDVLDTEGGGVVIDGRRLTPAALSSALVFHVRNYNQMGLLTVGPTGNVGINDTSPDYKLDVNGSDNTYKVVATDGTQTAGMYTGSAPIEGVPGVYLGAVSNNHAYFGSDSGLHFIRVATGTGALRISAATASRVVATDASKDLVYSFASSVLGSSITDETGAGGVLVFNSGPTFTGTTTADAFTATGNVILGDATTDTITFTGRAASSLLPTTDDTYDLGDDTHRWRDIFLGPGTAHIGTSTSDEGYLSYNTGTNVFSLESTGSISLLSSQVQITSTGVGIGVAPSTRLSIAGNLSAAYWSTSAIRLRVAGATFTDTSSSGSVSFITADSLLAPIFAASSSTTYADATTLLIVPPTAGSNVTITNAWGIVNNGGTLSVKYGVNSSATDVETTGVRPMIYGSTTGGSGDFNQAGHLFLQSRPSGADRDVIFVAGTDQTLRARVSEAYMGVLAGDDANSVYAKVGGNLKTNITSVGNVGAGEDDLITYSLGADTLDVNGDLIRFRAWGTWGATANNKRLRCYFGATAIVDSGTQAQNGGSWSVNALIVRTSATTQTATSTFVSSGTLFTDDASTTAPAETLTGAVTTKCTGEATSNNDVVETGHLVEYIPNGN